MTKIAILMQDAKMENAFVKEKELETGKTAEVRLFHTDLIKKLVSLTWHKVVYAVIIFSSLFTFER